MDINLQSAALIVPHFRAQFSAGITAIKDSFFAEEIERNETSPLFILPNDPDIMDFHHQEIVESTSQLPFCASSPNQNVKIDELDSLDTSDLFSFVLDTVDLSPGHNFPDPVPADTLASAFCDSNLDERPSSKVVEFVPSDFLDLFAPISSTDLAGEFNESLDNNDLPFDLESSYPASIRNFNCMPNSQGACSPSTFSAADFCTEESGVFSDEYDSDDYLEYGHSGKSTKFISDYLHNEDLKIGKPGQPLQLSSEEKRILIRMGQRIPKTFPLMHDEERAIRLMRRKIRNKLSAKASRTRRQEYLCTLESRISSCHKENHRLRRRVVELEKDKLGLLDGLRKMRSYVARLVSGVPMFTKSMEHKSPLLPITISSPIVSQNPSNFSFSKSRSAASGTSLLVIAFMILAWATLMPLPGLEFSRVSGSALIVKSRADPVSGRSRTLLTVDVPEMSDRKNLENKIKFDDLDEKIKNEFPLVEKTLITRDFPFSKEVPDEPLQFEPILQMPLVDL